MCDAATSTTASSSAVVAITASAAASATSLMHHDLLALDDLTANSSILEFLNHEQRCLLTDTARTMSASSSAASRRRGDVDNPEDNVNTADDDDDDDGTELDIESIFEEIQRLSGGTSRSGGGDGSMPERSMEDILREAEALISKQERDATAATAAANWRPSSAAKASVVAAVRDEEARGDSGSSSGRATMTGRSEAVVEMVPNNVVASSSATPQPDLALVTMPALHPHDTLAVPQPVDAQSSGSSTPASRCSTQTYSIESFRTPDDLPDARPTSGGLDEPTVSSATSSASPSPPATPAAHRPTFADKSTAASPSHDSYGRERALENALDELRETLKDTEERLHSMCLQHGTLAVAHRELRATHAAGCGEADGLRRDVAQLHECAAALRLEVQTARSDGEEAIRVQQQLMGELQEVRRQRDAAVERRDRDAGSVQDLQRQCREMERILMRKHPDSVSALIVASKNPANGIDDQSASRRLLEQRIAQLEADAREQDAKAQQILANVQSRFSTVQSKYEQHIGDLETQVISLQQINARLNEKIAAHLNRNHQITATQACQTMDPSPEHDTAAAARDTATQTNGKITGIHRNGTTNVNSSQIPTACGSRNGVGGGKPECCHGVHNAARDDAHLMATLRGMRVDLAIKEKAMQRLTRDLDDCKRTIRKLQREKDALLKGSKKPPQQQQQHQADDFAGETTTAAATFSNGSSSNDNNNHHGSSDETALAEYLNRIRLLEFDYNALHDKRLQDLKTLQAAHERELASCQATVHILQQRLTDRDVAFDAQKRRELERNAADRQQQQQQQQQREQQHKEQQQQQQQQAQNHQHAVPNDYMALKAKVSSLERRHSEREQRLHILVDALSKGGRLTGTPFDSCSSSGNSNSINHNSNHAAPAHGRQSSQQNGNGRMSVSAIPIMMSAGRDTETGCIGGRYGSSSGATISHSGSHTKLNHKLPVRKCKV